MKTLEQWKKEIDAGIARGIADFKNGNYYECNDKFFDDIIREVQEEREDKRKKDFFIINKFV